MTTMLDTIFVLIVITALLIIVGVCQPLAAYLKLPPPVLLGVVGVALGGFPALMSQLGWSSRSDPFADIFVELPVTSATFIYVFLPLLVFEAGIATDVRRMLKGGTDPVTCRCRDPDYDRSCWSGTVAIIPGSIGHLPAPRRRCGDNRPGRSHRDLSRYWRACAVDPARRRRSSAQRCGCDCAIRGTARNDPFGGRAGRRRRAAPVLSVFCRRWLFGAARGTRIALGDPLGA